MACFKDADHNCSGALDAHEVAQALHALYKAEGVSPPELAVTQECVNGIMGQFDTDGSGCLEFSEFVALVCTAVGLQTQLTDQEKGQVQELAALLEKKWATVEDSPQQRAEAFRAGVRVANGQGN